MAMRLAAIAAPAAVMLLTATSAAEAAAGPAWLAARAALRQCLTQADAGERGRCLENAARALDLAEADGEGPIATPQQARREAERTYGLHPGAVVAQAKPKAAAVTARKERKDSFGLVTVITGATLDASGNWLMTTREGAVWAQTDATMLSHPPGPGSTLAVRPGALGSFFCLINDRREVRCHRRS